jgi:hypothetical protein
MNISFCSLSVREVSSLDDDDMTPQAHLSLFGCGFMYICQRCICFTNSIIYWFFLKKMCVMLAHGWREICVLQMKVTPFSFLNKKAIFLQKSTSMLWTYDRYNCEETNNSFIFFLLIKLLLRKYGVMLAWKNNNAFFGSDDIQWTVEIIICLACYYVPLFGEPNICISRSL